MFVTICSVLSSAVYCMMPIYKVGKGMMASVLKYVPILKVV